METTLSLDELGKRLWKVDTLMLDIAKRRMALALQVERRKREEADLGRSDGHIIRGPKEKERVEEARKQAEQSGLNPNFAASLESLLILQSCHDQLEQREQAATNGEDTILSEEEEYAIKKKNLITLAEHWAASYDKDYDKGHFGTQAYKRFEREVIESEVATLPHRDILLDLGCATGTLTLPLCRHFEFSIGYDISSHMVDRAYAKSCEQALDARVSFEQLDVEQGIPIEDGTVSYAVMNLGTASDVRDIQGVIKEIMRVLKPGGRFFLSFYNKEAFAYRWEFIPWLVGLTASINIYKDCLEVYDPKTGREMPVYARRYTMDEVGALLGKSSGLKMFTYPAMSMILPSVLFEGRPGIEESIVAVDRALLSSLDPTLSTAGAYIIATGQK